MMGFVDLPLYKLLAVLSFALRMPHLMANTVQCDICPLEGQVLVNRNAMAGGALQHFTCGQVEVMGLVGMISPTDCKIMQGIVAPTCCGPSAPTKSPSPTQSPVVVAPVPFATQIPSTTPPRTHTDCLFTTDTIPDGTIRDICITESAYGTVCEAYLNGEECRRCWPGSLRNCPSVLSGGGYILDCTNVHSSYTSIRVCDDTIYVEDSPSQFGGQSSGNGHGSQNSGSHYSNQSYRDRSDSTYFATFILSSMLALVIIALKATRREERGSSIRVPSRSGPSDETTPLVSAVPVASVSPSTLDSIPAMSVSSGSDDIPIVSAEPALTAAKKRGHGSYSLELIAQDPFARKIHEEAGQGIIDHYLERIEEFREGNWDLRAAYVVIVEGNLVLKDDQWSWDDAVAERRESFPSLAASIRLIQGQYLISCAWEVRGSGWAYTVTSEAGEKMKNLLREARGAFLDAASLDPVDPTPYAFLQTVGMGLPDRAAAEEWLVEARARDKYNLKALNSHRYLLMGKWLGTSALESVNFARKIADECPVGHIANTVLIDALDDQIKDGAWDEQQRLKLAMSPWVRERIVEIFRSVFVNKPGPPSTIIEKHAFAKVTLLLRRFCGSNMLDRAILDEVQSVLSGNPSRTEPEFVNYMAC